MLRKLICLICLCFLCLPALADDAPSHLYHFGSAADAPAEIAAGVADLFGSDVTYIDGYATMRFGKWTYGQILLKDSESCILCGLTYLDTESVWKIEYSRTALRQDALPALLPEAVEYGYDDYQISQFDGCHSFKIVYDDLTYHWFHGTYGWMLSTITNPAQNLQLSVSSQAITRYALDNSFGFTPQAQSVFNVCSAALADFDASIFPTTWEEAAELSEASAYADQKQAVTTYTPWDYDDFNIEYADGVPLIRLYQAPSRDSSVIAQIFEFAEVSILDHEDYSTAHIVNDWYLIRIHDLTGWVQRDNLLIGSKRASAWHWMGEYALVYGSSAQTEQPVYAASSRTAPSAHIPVNTRVYAQLIDSEGCFLIRDEQGAYCWMNPDTVCMTDNLHDGYIYSEDPARRLNLRRGPGTQYPSIGKYYSGVRVVFLLDPQPVRGWSRVIIEGVSGWVDSRYLLTYSDYNGREWLPPLGRVQGVNSKGLNLRKEPGTAADIIAAYPVGTSVEILGIYDSIWAHVRLQDGSSGYMMLQYLGGEPEKAASNSFKLTRDLTTADFSGNALHTLPEGTRVRISERPLSYDNRIWIVSDDKYGFAATDAADFW